MQFRLNNFSPDGWQEIPEAGWLSKFRLIAPVPVGLYGEPSATVALMSNHESIFNATFHTPITLAILDGGGFPTEVAASLGLLTPPPDGIFLDYARKVKGDVAFCIPPCLSNLWGWRDGENRLGGVVRVTSEFYAPACGAVFSALLIRLVAFLRLAFTQFFLLLIPMMAFGFLHAALPSLFFLLGGMATLAVVWNYLPDNVWVKGGIIGAAVAGVYLALGFMNTLFISPLFAVGIFLLLFWLGGLARGVAADL